MVNGRRNNENVACDYCVFNGCDNITHQSMDWSSHYRDHRSMRIFVHLYIIGVINV